MRFRKWFFPRVIRAGAGPHDLGPGDNRGDTFPELTAHSDAGPTMGDDEGLEGQQGLTTESSDTGSDIVVRNISYVRLSQFPFVPADFRF